MGKIYLRIIAVAICCFTWLGSFNSLNAQCPATASCGSTTATGATCPLGNDNFGEIVPNNGCATFNQGNSFGPGQYFQMPVLLGGCYSISTCGSPIDTRLSCYEGNTTTSPFSYNDDNGPLCSGNNASVTFTPNFTDYTRVAVREGNCLPGGTASITVLVRQNNNLTFTSSAADMCAGESRTLTATPAPIITTPQPNSGNTGTFSGTGVVANVFSAPTPSGNSATYTINYDFGYCCTTQDIVVWRQPSASNAGQDQVVCDTFATIAGNAPAFGTGQWSIVSGPGTITNPGAATTTVNGLGQGQFTVLYWTITNGPCTAEIDSVIIGREVEPNPANAGADSSVCATQVMLNGNAPTVGNGLWSLIGGSGTITNSSSPSATVSNLGTGPNTFVWNIASGACTINSDTVVINRDALPTVAVAGPDISLCEDSLILNGNSPASGIGQWSLISGTGNITNPINPNSGLGSIQVGPSVLSWTITNGSCPPSTDTLQVVRNPAPALPTVSGSISICIGGSALLTAASGAANPSYTWWDAATGGNSLASTTVFNTGTLNTTTSYWVQVSDGATTCSSGRTMVTVTVNAAPVVSLGADSTVCAGTQVCFDAGPGFTSYAWSNGGGSGQTACYVGAGTYTVTVTSGANCTAVDTVVVNTLPAPQPNLGPDTDYCAGSGATIGVTGAPGNTYLWSNGGTTPMITVNTPGSYWMVCTDSSGCSGSDTISVTEIPGTTSAFSVDTSGCPQVVFTDNSTNATSWSWNFGDGGISVTASPTHNFFAAGNGTYTVTLISTGQCGSDTSTQSVSIGCLVGVNLPANLSVKVFPNPNHGSFQVEFTGMNDDAHLRVFNTAGQMVFDRNIVDQRGDFIESVELLRPAAGTYFVDLEISGVRITKRMIVE